MYKSFVKVIDTLVKYRNILVFIVLPLMSVYMHRHVFTMDIQGMHEWRQTETQTMIDNFAEKDMNILNPRVNNHGNQSDIFRMEFPLMEWIYAVFFKLFGDHIIISRILTFITGLFCVFAFYKLAYMLTRDYFAAMLAAFAFNFGPSFYFYTMNPMPDTMALCFALWGLVFFFKWYEGNRMGQLVLCAVFFTLATLVKLPFILNFSLIFVHEMMSLFRSRFKSIKHTLVTGLVCLLIVAPALAWYIWVIPGWEGNGIVQGMLAVKRDQLPVLWDIFHYNMTQMFPKLLLNEACLWFFWAGIGFIILRGFYKKRLFYLLLAWSLIIGSYYIFEINMIDKWHDYYLFPFLPFIFMLVLYGMYCLVKDRYVLPVLFVVIVCCFIPGNATLYARGRWLLDPNEVNPDIITYKKELRNAVPDSSLVIVANDISPFVYLYHIHKKGWTIDNYYLPEDLLAKEIHEGARYFYCDARQMDDKPELQKHFSKLVAQYGTVKVWALKE